MQFKYDTLQQEYKDLSDLRNEELDKILKVESHVDLKQDRILQLEKELARKSDEVLIRKEVIDSISENMMKHEQENRDLV